MSPNGKFNSNGLEWCSNINVGYLRSESLNSFARKLKLCILKANFGFIINGGTLRFTWSTKIVKSWTTGGLGKEVHLKSTPC